VQSPALIVIGSVAADHDSADNTIRALALEAMQ